ncbi:MAG: ribulokinase [Candidatus Hydrogenedentes bacterium]|nr:ribulokinase [Candidatus Hydrogenedentota bacterium]
MARKYVIGLDYGTESGRALLVAVDSGEEVGVAIENYGDGVIDEVLPGTGQKLPPDWALQNPRDYLCVLETVIPRVLQESGVSGEDVIGIGVDFTACTVLPIDGEGTPLCMQDRWDANPHAWVKLWKHHGAQPQADRLNELARKRGEDFLARYGGKVSSEWLFPKILQVLEEAPEVYDAADQFIEAGDWIVLQLTGALVRNACAAGYKAMWDEGYPSNAFLKALHPRLEHVVAEKLRGEVVPAGVRAGGLTAEMASRLGLKPGTAVGVGGIDAHVAVPSSTVTGPGKMVMIMGTSLCHMVCGEEKRVIDGMCGVVKDGILPGLYGFEAGQVAVGDIFAWFMEHCVPGEVAQAAKDEGTDVHGYLGRHAAELAVGENGLLCLDWWNGNRCILVDADLSGLIIGLTLATTPAEIYRALLESTAFGTYKIIKQLEQGGCPIDELYACGGLPGKNPLCMQIFADVTGREIKVAASDQTVALGAAIWGAVAAGKAAGGYDSVQDAAQKMARLRNKTFRSNLENNKKYQPLFAEYERLHDYFGRGENNVMKTLKALKRAARS